MRSIRHSTQTTFTFLGRSGIYFIAAGIPLVRATLYDIRKITMSIKIALLTLSLTSLSIALPTAYATTTLHTKRDQQTVTLDMQNMTCPMCQFTIKKALQNVAGVQQVTVDFESKTAIINFDAKKTNSETLIKATTNAGYPATKHQEKQ